MNTRRYYKMPFTTTLSKADVANHQAVALFIAVIIIPQISGSGWRLRWHR